MLLILTVLVLKTFQKKLENSLEKKIILNIFRIQEYDSIMCGYFSIGFIDFILEDKRFFDYKNIFPPNDYEKNDKIILKFFQ